MVAKFAKRPEIRLTILAWADALEYDVTRSLPSYFSLSQNFALH